ncbi:MAG TPA: D-alanyl-D-alanine carboxypeptidase/D-alanyl-D-alanine-endopeptidase [Pyrinomonadaceae bacterium]|jgi:D-alanyl-D-alanine carboxypeptidase/D-alanyl-D-alanine-endopeptidase (penicillin-binding protein 4)
MKNYFCSPAKNAKMRENKNESIKYFASLRVFRGQKFLLTAALSFTLSLTSCFNQPPATETNQNAAVPETPVTPSNIDLGKPLEVSAKPEDAALARKIDETIEKSEFRDARWGVFVVSLKDGRVLAARDARKLFTPASTLKILTSTVALDRLGADFRWRTRVFAREKIENGALSGDLILYGEGAPDLSDEGLQNLVAQLKAKGLQKVKGDVVGDESYFTGDAVGDGWAWNELQWYYGAAASALSVNRNFVNVSLENGAPKAEPATADVELSGAVARLQNGDAESIGLKRELGSNRVYVWGEGTNLDARVAVENPALWSAKILRAALVQSGIAVDGAAKSTDWKAANKFDPESSAPLGSVESQTLGEIVRRMNKDSVNLYAELILRTLGRKFGAEIPDENPNARKTRGTDAAGAAVIKKWLAEHSAAGLQETESIKDGSGLSRLNFVTPETIGRALIAANQIEAAEAFRNSLPVAGRDGTLRGRLASAGGKISAKTGSIMFVNALAGYARRRDETLAFVILCNNETRKADSSVLIDAIAASLID